MMLLVIRKTTYINMTMTVPSTVNSIRDMIVAKVVRLFIVYNEHNNNASNSNSTDIS